MSEKRLTAKATMQIMVEVFPSDTWGEDCKMDQVYQQGQDSAMGELREMMSKFPRIKIVGQPTMKAIVFESK